MSMTKWRMYCEKGGMPPDTGAIGCCLTDRALRQKMIAFTGKIC